MKVYIFDCEVFAFDWLFVFKEYQGDDIAVIHNDNDAVKLFMSSVDDLVLCGFNNKHYDNFILSAVMSDASPEVIKDINDFIISGNEGWEHPFVQDNRVRFDNFDLMDDMQQGTSLKSIEAHLGMNIEETQVDFNIDRPLTTEELKLTIQYCKFDVQATEKLCEIRKDYLATKMKLGRMRNIPDEVSLACTNAKIVAKYLLAQRQEHNDGRDYVYPQNLDTSVIPQPILDFFNTIHDTSIPDDVLFKTSFDITIKNCPCKYAWGGVHGSLESYEEESNETRVIQNRDVASLYPSLMLRYKYISRNIESFDVYQQTYDERIAAKHAGDKQKSKSLKLVLNTCSGAAENAYNDLYDPLSARSMRISGQLFLTVLAVKLAEIPSLEILNFNTDGIMYSVDRIDLPKVDEISKAWEQQTGFELETDEIQKVCIKDVNNLLMIKSDGEIKKVGGYLNYGISEKGAWAINNNFVIVKQAVADYLAKGISVEETIQNCNDLSKFQIIAKAGSKYKEAYQIVNGEKVVVQRCNRVYSTADKSYGTLYKVKKEDDSIAKISNLPPHCIVDNDNHLTINDIDKKWYINLAKRYVGDYRGIKRKKPDNRKISRNRKKIINILEDNIMAKKETAPTGANINVDDIKSLNVYEKLNFARIEFLASDVKKSGRHLKPNYKYFELTDIVPVAQPIFFKYRLMVKMSFKADEATATVINIDKPEETIEFTSPMKEIESIYNQSGSPLTNAIQNIGSVETYSRRYLYFAILDIVEQDSIDGAENDDDGAVEPVVVQPPKPATAEERTALKAEITGAEEPATELQLTALKEACAKWREIDSTADEEIQRIALETNGFQTLSKEKCEALVIMISNTIEAYNMADDGGEANV